MPSPLCSFIAAILAYSQTHSVRHKLKAPNPLQQLKGRKKKALGVAKAVISPPVTAAPGHVMEDEGGEAEQGEEQKGTQ